MAHVPVWVQGWLTRVLAAINQTRIFRPQAGGRTAMASLTGSSGSVRCHFSSAITRREIHQPPSAGSRPSPSMLSANKSIRSAALCILASVLHTNVDYVWSQSGCNSSKTLFGFWWDLSDSYPWFSCLKPSFNRCLAERQQTARGRITHPPQPPNLPPPAEGIPGGGVQTHVWLD